MQPIALARLCHQANKALCESMGDNSQPEWRQAPAWQRASAIDGVLAHLRSDLTPEQSHESWMAHKEAEGWVYGEVKNPDAKTHPCMVQYSDLPVEQQRKDHLFKFLIDLHKDSVELPELPVEEEPTGEEDVASTEEGSE